MLFKTAYMSAQYHSQDSELRAVLFELDAVLKSKGITEFTISEGWRRHLPGKPFSYHYIGCAVDFRSSEKDAKQSKMYTSAESRFIMGWLSRRCPPSGWEVLEHDAGTGLHFHLARKDLEGRKKWEAAQRSVK